MAKTNFGITPMQQHAGWHKYDECRFDKKKKVTYTDVKKRFWSNSSNPTAVDSHRHDERILEINRGANKSMKKLQFLMKKVDRIGREWTRQYDTKVRR